MEQVTISLESALKEKAETYFLSIGTTLQEYLQSCVRNSVIDHELNEETLEALEECEEMIRTGDFGKTYDSVPEMMKDILK